MYAIIETGGKQYRVSEGDIIRVEKLAAAEGQVVEFDRVLAVSRDGELLVGKPWLENAKVTATVLKHGKSDKIIVFKYKPKKNYRRKQGHRQPFSEIKIEKIEGYHDKD
jgi:large subunit ribosomal protein L21